MNKQLYELAKESSELDSSFIYDAFDILMDNEREDLDDYIKDFGIDEKSPDLADYSPDTRVITINPRLISSMDGLIYRDFDKRLLAIRSMVHEIEHAKGLKKVYEGRNDIESLLQRYAFVDYLIKHKLDSTISIKNEEPLYVTYLRRMYYDYNPGERLANIKASKFLVNMLKTHKKDAEQLAARTMLLFAYGNGYEDNRYYIDPPTYTYLMKMGMFREHYLLTKRVRENDYSFETRITHGLPITYSESTDDLFRKVRLQLKR